MQFSPRALLFALLFSADVALSSPLHSRYVYTIKDSHNVPKAWSRVGPAPSEHWISLQIGLKQSQFDELERQLYQGWKTELCVLYHRLTCYSLLQSPTLRTHDTASI